MKFRYNLLAVFFVFILGVFFVLFTLRSFSVAQLDITKVNDIVNTVSGIWEQIQGDADLPILDNELNYVIIDSNGKLLAATRNDLNENVSEAIRNRDTIVDVTVGNQVAGKVIFYNDIALIWEQYRSRLMTGSICVLGILALLSAGYTLYLYHTLLRPFYKLKAFARHIAAGTLDIPLEMDRSNLFGAFTESFDLMRDELKKAKENERKADRSKKELVASLSHDIKTPVASIKAVSELMLVTKRDEKEIKQLEAISAKAEQIDALITNMFHATLKELQALSVSVTELHSTLIYRLIKDADYEGRVKPFDIPSCIVLADPLRLQQVLDNIIGNSYKYAGTDIEIYGAFDERFIVIDIVDFGAGVQEDELTLLSNKFYRGKNADGKSGYGLGLYISGCLLEQMSGRLQCKNHKGGFTVRLLLSLA